MKKLTVEKARPEHFHKIRLRDFERVFHQAKELFMSPEEIINHGPCYALIENDTEVVAMCGFIIQDGATGFCWVMGSDLIYQYKKTFHSEVKKHLLFIPARLGIKKLYCFVEKGWGVGQRWMEKLGFSYVETVDDGFGVISDKFILMV